MSEWIKTKAKAKTFALLPFLKLIKKRMKTVSVFFSICTVTGIAVYFFWNAFIGFFLGSYLPLISCVGVTYIFGILFICAEYLRLLVPNKKEEELAKNLILTLLQAQQKKGVKK